MKFHGVLVEAHLNKPGTDQLTSSEGNCTSCAEPHPFAPYLPPRAPWLDRPTFVTVETLPLRPYLVAAHTPPAS